MIIEKWKNSQSYIIGRYHIDNNLPCQDRTYYLEGKGVMVASLADGAGSKSKSQFGAELVTKLTCELLIEKFDSFLVLFEQENIDKAKHNYNMNIIKETIITYLVENLRELAVKENVNIRELSSTLLFFAMKGDHYIVGHIGDGVIATIKSVNDTPYASIVSAPENAEAANVTFFVPDSNAVEHLRISHGSTKNLRFVLLSSDGASDLVFGKKGPDKNFYKLYENFAGILPGKYNQILERFLREIIATYSTDDLSLNLLMLEQYDTDSPIQQDYVRYLLSGIYSPRQITQKSAYCFHLQPSDKPNGKQEFKTLADIMRYLKWN